MTAKPTEPVGRERLIEQVAHAIASEDGGPGNPLGYFPSGGPMRTSEWDEFMPQQREAWRAMARAAIAAYELASPQPDLPLEGWERWQKPEVEEDDGVVCVQAFSQDNQRLITFTVYPERVLVTETAVGEPSHTIVLKRSALPAGGGGGSSSAESAASSASHSDCSAAPHSAGWQPIDSAPRDGTWFLAFNGHWRGVAKYTAPYHGDEGDEFQDPVWVDETSEFIEPEPTHWQPLPSPPEPLGPRKDGASLHPSQPPDNPHSDGGGET